MILSKEIDAHEIIPRIWVGSLPPRGNILHNLGFTHVILCASDFQFPAEAFGNITVIHCPYDDNDTVMSAQTMALVFATARGIVEAHKAGGNILVTCAAGRNRSALVAALTIRLLGNPAIFAVESIRAKRSPQCLSNVCFMRIALGINKETGFYLKPHESN